MTSHGPEFCILWLRGIIAGTIGLSLGGCATRDFDDLAGETSTEGTTEGETEGTVPNEPVACSEMDIVVEGPVLPDGTCGPCDVACQNAANMIVQESPSCSDYCSCDAYAACTPMVPDENGLCLHGFYYAIECGEEGRPLLVGDEIRVAPACARSDWSDAVSRLEVPAVLRERVRAGWLDRAAMEHASIAAFARFTLQLVGLGASAELIDAAQVAGRDEARHARLCYGVASQLGDPVGPDRLDLRGLDLDVDPARVVFESIVEGCIGETIAAAKMRYLAERAENPELAAMLESIAEDEAAHAALAWKALDWMLRNFDVAAVARETFASVLRQSSVSRTRPHESAMLRYGVLDEATGTWVAAAVLRDVIAPAAAGLLGARATA
jgi:hypothetical protein